jgi:hypothetical protein
LQRLQRKLLNMGIIREEDVGEANGHDAREMLLQAADGREAFLRLICQPRESVLPLLKEEYGKQAEGSKKLAIAKALCWFGETMGVLEVIQHLRQLDLEERSAKLDPEPKPIGGLAKVKRGGHSQKDFDPSNTNQGQLYWDINGLITLLGMAGDGEATGVLCEMAERIDAGGPPYDHVRLHWRRVPHYDRIVCLCSSLERLAANNPAGISTAAHALETLIGKPHLGGFAAKPGPDAGGYYASAYLELVIARTMARCGSKQGLRVLTDYVDDVQAILARYAHTSLQEITGWTAEQSSAAWKRRIVGQWAQATQN